MLELQRMKDEGILPLRVTHNDTKANNLLFDHNDHPLCVIDLDTVMPGIVHYDLQAVRFLTDYLDGDHYYPITYPEHNLQRAKVQVRLLQDMERQFDKMNQFILNQ